MHVCNCLSVVEGAAAPSGVRAAHGVFLPTNLQTHGGNFYIMHMYLYVEMCWTSSHNAMLSHPLSLTA